MQKEERIGLGELSALIPMLQKHLPEYQKAPYSVLWAKLGKMSKAQKRHLWDLLEFRRSPRSEPEAREILLSLVLPRERKERDAKTK